MDSILVLGSSCPIPIRLYIPLHPLGDRVLLYHPVWWLLRKECLPSSGTPSLFFISRYMHLKTANPKTYGVPVTPAGGTKYPYPSRRLLGSFSAALFGPQEDYSKRPLKSAAALQRLSLMDPNPLKPLNYT